MIIKARSLLPFLKWENQLLYEIGARDECCGIQCVPACPQPPANTLCLKFPPVQDEKPSWALPGSGLSAGHHRSNLQQCFWRAAKKGITTFVTALSCLHPEDRKGELLS